MERAMTGLKQRLGTLLAAAAIALSLLAVACGDDDAPATPTSSAATPTTAAPTEAVRTPTTALTATPPPTKTPIPSPTTAVRRIGRPELDRIADLVRAADVDGLVALVKYTKLACVTNVQGSGGPPECTIGEASGTIVDVLPFAGCEGGYTRARQIRAAMESQVRDTQPKLYAAYALKDRGTDAFPKGVNGVLFELASIGGSGPLGLQFGVDEEGRIINLWRGCGASPAQLLEGQAGSPVFLQP